MSEFFYSHDILYEHEMTDCKQKIQGKTKTEEAKKHNESFTKQACLVNFGLRHRENAQNEQFVANEVRVTRGVEISCVDK